MVLPARQPCTLFAHADQIILEVQVNHWFVKTALAGCHMHFISEICKSLTFSSFHEVAFCWYSQHTYLCSLASTASILMYARTQLTVITTAGSHKSASTNMAATVTIMVTTRVLRFITRFFISDSEACRSLASDISEKLRTLVRSLRLPASEQGRVVQSVNEVLTKLSGKMTQRCLFWTLFFSC